MSEKKEEAMSDQEQADTTAQDEVQYELTAQDEVQYDLTDAYRQGFEMGAKYAHFDQHAETRAREKLADPEPTPEPPGTPICDLDAANARADTAEKERDEWKTRANQAEGLLRKVTNPYKQTTSYWR